MFTLTVETDNDVFQRGGLINEIDRIWHDVRLALAMGYSMTKAQSGVVRDTNGNTVGRWELTP